MRQSWPPTAKESELTHAPAAAVPRFMVTLKECVPRAVSAMYVDDVLIIGLISGAAAIGGVCEAKLGAAAAAGEGVTNMAPFMQFRVILVIV